MIANMLNRRNNVFAPFLLLASLFTTASIIFSFLAVSPVFADGINPACPSVYGATCPAGQLTLDKKIQNPKTGELMEAINANDITFVADQEVNFRIEVKNIGSTNLNSILVQDILPGFVTFVSGPGNFDANSKTLSWTVDNLKAAESRFFSVKTKIKPQNELPQSSITCLTNFAQASKDNLSAKDTAVFCIQTPNVTGKGAVLPAEQLPKTGLPLVAWSLVGLLPAGLGLKRTLSYKKDNQDKPFYISQKRDFEKES